MKLVKAEILFSRKCNLKCSYCNMVDGRENSLSVENWKKGMDNLKRLDCTLAVFYGAEPLLEFDKLLEVLPYAESIGIDTSVITNGTIVGTKNKLKKLYDAGARSLSMSYDPISIDKSSQIKSDKAIELLTWFRKLGKNVRDVAAIATVTKENYMELPQMVEKMSSLGIWTFYDIYHFDRHQPGSKTSAYNPRFAFDNTMDRKSLLDILWDVDNMRKQGFLIHTNDHYLKVLEKQNHQILENYDWNCADYDCFPSFVTVDCDGVVYPCVPNYKRCKITVLQGTKKIENCNTLRPSDITIGDTLIGLDEKTGEFKPTKVTKIYKRTAEEYYRISCNRIGGTGKKLNKVLLLTGEHPVRVGDSWIKVKDLKIGEEIQFLTEGDFKKLKYWKEIKCDFCDNKFFRRKKDIKEKHTFCSKECSFKWTAMKKTGCNNIEEYNEWKKENTIETLCFCGCGGFVTKGKYCSGHNPDTKIKLSKISKGKWIGDKNPMKDKKSKCKVLTNKNYLDSRQRSLTKAMQANKNYPSSIEKEFINFINQNTLPIDYVGDGKLWVGNKNPDFKIKGQKKVIEVIHSYKRDNGEYKKKRVQAFGEEGYKCLVLSREEIQKDCSKKINQFIHNGWKIEKIKINKTKGAGKIVYNYSCSPYNSYLVNGMMTHNCDDFQPEEAGEFNIVDLHDEWPNFRKKMKLITKSLCPGCCWNTKIGAHAIKVGLEDINDYIHGK